MTFIKEIVTQTIRNILAHKLRSTLTMFGIAWGIASVILMIAIGDGFKIGYRDSLRVLGTDIAIIWGGRTASQAGGQRAGRDVRLTYDDVLAIRKECYLVAHASPELARSLQVRSPFNSGVFRVHGVAPIYQQIRSMTLAQGRRLNQGDFDERRTVCLIGSQVKKQLFADRQAVGAEIRILNIPFVVISVLKKKEQNNSYSGLDDNKILIPYTTMATYFPDPRPSLTPGYVNNIIVTPVSTDVHDQALRQVKRVLGRRHGFDPRDDGALWIWDTVESAQMVARIFDTMQLFLGFVAVVTLSLGGVGVMNIMLVSVAERTREIGLKKAIGATRRRILFEFFLESLALTLVSGAVGLLFAWGVSAVVNRLPLPTLFAGLPITHATALIAFVTLSAVGVLSGIYPARRASDRTPVEALRSE